MNLIGELTGDFGNLDGDLSWLKLQIGNTIVHEMKINSSLSNFEINLDSFLHPTSTLKHSS